MTYSQGNGKSFCMKNITFDFPQAPFTGSSKLRASRETASEPVFDEKHKNAF